MLYVCTRVGVRRVLSRMQARVPQSITPVYLRGSSSPTPERQGWLTAQHHDRTYRADVGTVLVVHELPDLPDSGLECEQAVQEVESGGRPSCVAAHPRLDVVHVVVDLVHDLHAPWAGD
jgi:hypothetical protein